jgi:ribosomal protein S18 acetylase RimI-like enzyme
MEFELVETDDAAARERVLKPLDDYNEAMIGRGHSESVRSLSILRREGGLVGGLVGVAYWDWLHVDLLYLPPEWRGGGAGARLMAYCLGVAARHGLEGVWLHTLSVQAPGLYRKQGFQEFATLPDHPVGHADHYLLRRMRGADTRDVAPPPGFIPRDAVDPGERKALATGLRGFTDAATGTNHRQPLGLLLPGTGGLWGWIRHCWLFVELLGIPEAARGEGTGTRLMREAERIAASRGCVGVYLDTCSFQAPGFYEKLGYTRFGTVPDHPRGFARHFYARRLDGRPLLAHNAPPLRDDGASA